MQGICARYDRCVDDRAVATAKLRTIGIGLDLELLKSFHGRLDHVISFV